MRLAPDGAPKLFYTLPIGEEMPVPVTFSAGSFDGYASATIRGKEYAPVIVGSDEAAMMIEEKLFERPGETIEGFFGQDIIIVGVLEKTGTPLDMLHVTPFTASQLS